MNTRSFSWVLLGPLALAGACAGGNMTEESAIAPMAEAEPAAAQTMTLGGGTAIEVHPGDAGSPHVKVDWMVDGANISITYGRPYLNGRVIGETVEPMADRLWRLGADEATTLLTDRDMMVGDAHLPAGEYTLWTMHMNDAFHLIINSETGQWGLDYDSSHDLAHVPMDVEELDPPAEQLTMSIGDGKLGFDWGTMRASVPIMVH